jgi:hypothetical protein
MISEFLLDDLELREPFASQRSELTIRYPGDVVRHKNDIKSNGMVVAIKGNAASVLWTVDPDRSRMMMEEMIQMMLKDVANGIDAEILQDLMIANKS